MTTLIEKVNPYQSPKPYVEFDEPLLPELLKGFLIPGYAFYTQYLTDKTIAQSTQRELNEIPSNLTDCFIVESFKLTLYSITALSICTLL